MSNTMSTVCVGTARSGLGKESFTPVGALGGAPVSAYTEFVSAIVACPAGVSKGLPHAAKDATSTTPAGKSRSLDFIIT